MRRWLSAGAVCAVIASIFVVSSPAYADPFPCSNVWGPGTDPGAKCAYVINVAADSSLNVRTGPGTSYPIATTLRPGQVVEIYCWTEGTWVNGYNIWTGLDMVVLNRFVSDFYLSTGRVQNFVPHC